ncbi:RCC1 domain-containing protein 1 [Pyxicephalus adspersus]|uniref:RCC1 domain-containing protein 1 n=1 Tax=Pyxicephalus adspersus TaxID=30357 RepID=UPI003B5CFA00
MLWFGFGFRGFGQIGEGETVPVNEPVQIKGSNTEKKPIIKAVPSWSYSACVTEDGRLLLSGFLGGSPRRYLCFNGLDCQDVLPSEKYIVLLRKDRAECWNTISIDPNGTPPEPMWKMEVTAAPESGKVFPLVGNGYLLPQPPFFRELSPTLQAQRIALGNEHVVLLTSDGKILTWGAGRHGQLGHGDVEDVWEPRIVEALHGVTMKEVAAGGWHSASISEGGDVYCWGWNESGQLGLPSKTLAQERESPADVCTEDDNDEDNEYIAVQSFPALIDLPQESEALKISCGSRHTAAVTRSGELYTWGWGRHGQLGHGDMKSSDHPRHVDFFPQKKLCVIDVICRHWNTFVLCQET